MRRMVFFALIFSLVLIRPSIANAADDATNQIKQAIVADSAMMHGDFETLTTENIPRPSTVEDKSLTLMLLALKVTDDEKASEQFRFLTDGYPTPSTLAEELFRLRQTGKRRILLEPVTFIHPDRITDFQCKIDADKAAGTVWFQVPKLYQGKVDYVARKLGGKWFVTEFMMPAYGIHLVRADDGLWKKKL